MPPVESLPGEIVTTTRDAEIEKWKRSFRIRVPDADVGPGSQVDIDARVAADAIMPLYAAAKVIGNNTVLEESTGEAVDQWAEREGVSARREEVGASGHVEIVASSGGGTIVADDELVHEDTGLRFKAISTGTYADEDSVAIIGVDTGPDTNLAAGTQLKWSSPRPGIGASAVVVEQSDGSGLSGGRNRESDDELKARVLQEKQTRAASGNDAEYQLLVEGTPDVSVQKCFTYPCIDGPGTTAVVFTMRPARSGGSRIPNAAQISLVESYVVGEMPADDGAYFCVLLEEDTDVAYAVTWDESAAGWEDIAPWPPFYEVGGTPGPVIVSAATSATSFTLSATSYTGIQQPQTGQTIAFYDPDEFEFVRKRILSFTGTGPWVITVDTTNNVSDTSYTPAVGQRACPWSDSLDSILPGLHAYFDTLGPGEQVATFYDEGRRQRRQPRPPRYWPSELTTRDLIRALDDVSEVADVDVFEGDGEAPTVGVAGVSSNMLALRFVSAFPEDD
jgi:uncharacterized phage protein gp47/JayE